MNDFQSAYLPAVGMTGYVVLDHLYDYLPQFMRRKIKKTLRIITALMVIALAFWCAAGQYAKAKADSEYASLMQTNSIRMQQQLDLANSELTNTHTDIRILRGNIVNKMEDDHKVFMAMAQSTASLPVLVALADEYKSPIIFAGGSKSLSDWANEFDDRYDRTTKKKEVDDLIAAKTNLKERLIAEGPIIKIRAPLLMHSVDMLYSFLSSNVLRSGDVMSPRCTYLLDAEALVASNFHLCDIVIGTNAALRYNCEIRKGNGNEPISDQHPMFADITCNLPNGQYEFIVGQSGDHVRTEIHVPGKGCWCDDNSMTNSDNTVFQAISVYASKTAIDSHYSK
jgi:hypothetical protein